MTRDTLPVAYDRHLHPLLVARIIDMPYEVDVGGIDFDSIKMGTGLGHDATIA